VSEGIISPCGNFRYENGGWVPTETETIEEARNNNQSTTSQSSQNITDNVIGGDAYISLGSREDHLASTSNSNQNIEGNVVQGDMTVTTNIVNNISNSEGIDEIKHLLVELVTKLGISDTENSGTVLSSVQSEDVKQKLTEIENYSIQDPKILMMLGNASKLVFQPYAAIDYYTSAENEFSSQNNEEGEIMALISLGGVYKQMNQFEQATEIFAKSILLAKTAGLTDLAARGNCDFGHLYYNLNRFSTSKETYYEALDSLNENTDPNISMEVYLRLGELYSNTNNSSKNPRKADRYFTESMKFAKSTNNLAAINRIKLYQGNFEYSRENFSLSLEYFEDILKSSDEGEDDPRTIDAKIGVGRNLIKQKRYQDSIQILNQARSFSESQKYVNGVANSCYYLGKSHIECGNSEEALDHFKTSLRYFEEQNNLQMELQANLEIGMILRDPQSRQHNKYLIRARQLQIELRLN
jgi:tetratricopeptide (TPR) repeat protein